MDRNPTGAGISICSKGGSGGRFRNSYGTPSACPNTKPYRPAARAFSMVTRPPRKYAVCPQRLPRGVPTTSAAIAAWINKPVSATLPRRGAAGQVATLDTAADQSWPTTSSSVAPRSSPPQVGPAPSASEVRTRAAGIRMQINAWRVAINLGAGRVRLRRRPRQPGGRGNSGGTQGRRLGGQAHRGEDLIDGRFGLDEGDAASGPPQASQTRPMTKVRRRRSSQGICRHREPAVSGADAGARPGPARDAGVFVASAAAASVGVGGTTSRRSLLCNDSTPKYDVPPRRRRQGRQSRDQSRRRQRHLRGAVRPRPLQLEPDEAIGARVIGGGAGRSAAAGREAGGLAGGRRGKDA